MRLKTFHDSSSHKFKRVNKVLANNQALILTDAKREAVDANLTQIAFGEGAAFYDNMVS